MTALETYQRKFADDAWSVFKDALRSARRLAHTQIGVAHLIGALLEAESEIFAEFLQKLGIAPETFKKRLKQQIAMRPASVSNSIRLDRDLIELLQRAFARALANSRERITNEDLLAGLAQFSDSAFAELLKDLGCHPYEVAIAMLACFKAQRMDSRVQGKGDEEYHAGDLVRITSGPFQAFSGRVREVHTALLSVSISVNIFGRSQLLDLPFSAVQKLGFK